MNPSSLQLNWVTYPSASYELVDEFEGEHQGFISRVDVSVRITWDTDDEHMAMLTIKSADGEDGPYRFSVLVAATFGFDIDQAIKQYSLTTNYNLPAVIAVNVANMLFSGAREHIAMMTARAPRGAVHLEAIMFEPKDLKIDSTADPEEVLRTKFKVSDEDIALLKARASDLQKARKKAAKKNVKVARNK